MNKIHKLSISLFVLMSIHGYAATSANAPDFTPSSDTPLVIVSESFEMNLKTGVNIYKGNVQATHGKSTLQGDKITTYRNKDNKIEKVVTIGNPATMHAEEDASEKPVDATAQTIIFHPIAHLVDLQGNAEAIQENNVIRAPRIRYNTETKVLQAQSSKDQRMHMLLYNNQQTATSPSTSAGKK